MFQVFRTWRRMRQWTSVTIISVSTWPYSGLVFSRVLTLHHSRRLAPRPFLLLYHFFSVAFYSIRIMFTLPKPRRASPKPHSDADIVVSSSAGSAELVKASFVEYPWLLMRGISVVSLTFLISSSPILSYIPLRTAALDCMCRFRAITME